MDTTDKTNQLNHLLQEMVAVEKLNKAPYNPRLISSIEFDSLKKSLQEFGFVEPLVVNTREHESFKPAEKMWIIVGGHQRFEAAKKLGYKEVPVVFVNLNKEREKILNLALNKISGDWDNDKLAEILYELTQEDEIPEADILGFSHEEISAILDTVMEIEEEEDFSLDEEVDKTKNTTVKTGDIYQIGKHRLMCGDATKLEDVKKLMDGKKANMTFTDPPYNVDYGSTKASKRKDSEILNDKLSPDEWEDFNRKWITNMQKVSDGDIYVWGAPGPDGMKQRLLLIELGYHWSTTIIWKKQQLVLSFANYQRMYEPCFYGWYNKSSFIANRTQTEVWEIDRPHNSEQHPTMKPVELCIKGIINSSSSNDIILDLFGGSGSTLIAAEQTNRTCYMMELDPQYVQIIINRIEKLSGQKAIKI